MADPKDKATIKDAVERKKREVYEPVKPEHAARLHPQQRRLHRLPRLRDRLQGQERPGRRAALPPRACTSRAAPIRTCTPTRSTCRATTARSRPACRPARPARSGSARRTASSTSTRRCASAAAAARPPARTARRSSIPEQNIVTKCNLCVDEIEAGRKPYCVMACMMRVLDIGPIDKLRDGTHETKARGPERQRRAAGARTWPIRS